MSYDDTPSESREDTHLQTQAIKIADMVRLCGTDRRGDLFLAIAENLGQQSQGYTAKLFASIALQYGLSKHKGNKRA